MFIFKKIFSQFFYPLPLIIYISFVAIYLLWFTKKQKTGKILVTIGMFMLILFSYGWVTNTLLRHLEKQYNASGIYSSINSSLTNKKGQIKLIVVLGGGHTSDPEIPLTSQINSYSLVRLIEGIRIYREIPDSKLLLSGGSGFGQVSNAKIMADVAKAVGIDEDDLIIESESKDTKDQAIIIKSFIENDPFILVTSAAHMPRSMALFKKLGMNPVPAPTGHLVKTGKSLSSDIFFPGSDEIAKAENAFHEYLGLVWAKLRGQI